MKELELKLNDVFVNKVPFQLPSSARKWIGDYAWVFALVGLVLGVMAFFPLLAGLGLVSVAGTAFGSGHLIALAWLSLLAMAAYLVVLGMSISPLKAKKARGWSLIYYATLAFFVYDVALSLSNIEAGTVIGLLWNTVWLVISLYFIFQVRSQFKGSSKQY